MLKIAICDDTPSFLAEVQTILQRWPNRPAQLAVSIFTDADALIEAHEADPFDLILLDMVMPLCNGIQAASEIRNLDRAVKIIFLTSSPEFAVDSYTVKASNYLLKPLNEQKFFDALDEIHREILDTAKTVTVKNMTAVHHIRIQDIEYLESQGKLVLFYLPNGRMVYGSDPLYAYAQALSPADGFFKCHRSYLVNIHKIRTYTQKEITTVSGCRIPISRGCQKDFESAYFTTLFGKAGDL